MIILTYYRNISRLIKLKIDKIYHYIIFNIDSEFLHPVLLNKFYRDLGIPSKRFIKQRFDRHVARWHNPRLRKDPKVQTPMAQMVAAASVITGQNLTIQQIPTMISKNQTVLTQNDNLLNDESVSFLFDSA